MEQMYLLAALIAVQSDFSRANRIGNCAVFMLAEIHPCSACGPEHIAHYGNKITDIVVAVKADEQVCKLCDQRQVTGCCKSDFQLALHGEIQSLTP